MRSNRTPPPSSRRRWPEHAAKDSLHLTEKQLQAGYVNYLALVSAEQTYQQTVVNLVQAQANRYADTAALFLALVADGGTAPISPTTSHEGKSRGHQNAN